MTTVILILGVVIAALAIMLWLIRRDTRIYEQARRRKARRMRRLRKQMCRDENR